MQALLKNDIFDGNDGCQYRVLKPTSVCTGWVINLSQPNQWPVERDFGVLRSHSPRTAVASTYKSPDFAFYSETARSRANAAYEAIKPLLLNPDGTENTDILCESKRSELVRARADELKMSKTTIYRYLSLWWTQGQSKLVLIPGSARNGKSKLIGTMGRGRPSSDGHYQTFQMSAEDIEVAKKFIGKRYVKRAHATLTSVHRDLIAEHYSFEDGDGNITMRPEGEHPSIHQLRNILKNQFTQEDVIRGKFGDKEFEREHNPMVGSALEEAVAPGHIYEIDATILDLFLVAIANRECIIGKPTLYLIYDRKTRLCVGFYLGLENASWTSAMLAILSIAADKRALCEKYDHPYDPRHWPADGIFPSKFLGDRGEMASFNSDRICDGMESTISNTQALLPIRKGLVESQFRATHAAIKSNAPGYEPPREAKKRRGRKYHLDAALTLEECTKLILGVIIEHNTTIMKNYELSPEQTLAEWSAIPSELWSNEVEHNGCSGTRHTYDYLRMQLMPRDKAIVTQEGISFHGCHYASKDKTIRQWMIQAGLKKKFKVECSYDPRLVNKIIVHGAGGKTYSCELAKGSEKYEGYSFAEVKYVRARARQLKRGKMAEEAQAGIDRQVRANVVIAGAKKATKAALTGATRSARRADTAAARNAEKSSRRRAEVQFPTTTNEGSVTQCPSTHDAREGLGTGDVPPVSAAPARVVSPLDIILRQQTSQKTNELINR